MVQSPCIGVKYARDSLKRSEEEAKTEFEDKLWQEYRSIVSNLPVGVMLGDDNEKEEVNSHLKWFFAYFDLTNSQIYLRIQERVRPETWTEWCDGIRDHFGKPSFKIAWDQIRPKAISHGTLKELRRLEKEGFIGDPKEWSD